MLLSGKLEREREKEAMRPIGLYIEGQRMRLLQKEECVCVLGAVGGGLCEELSA